MRRALLTASSGPALPAIGAPFMGGYYAGIMDTTKGNIIAADASQTGLRYALIVGPKSLETTAQGRTSNSSGPSGSWTRWDGLTATAALNNSTYPAAQYCAGLTYPSDGASAWYLGAMDELELLYRNLRCSTESNATGTVSGRTFPGGTLSIGANPSSAPVGAAYTTTVPAQTSVGAFQSGGAQALGAAGATVMFWSSTFAGASDAHLWRQQLSGNTTPGSGSQFADTPNSVYSVRPVRRFLLD